jgi:hypothetical protein
VIDGFEVLKTATLDVAVRELRDIEAEWKSQDDPIAMLDDIRSDGEPEPVNGRVRQSYLLPYYSPRREAPERCGARARTSRIPT